MDVARLLVIFAFNCVALGGKGQSLEGTRLYTSAPNCTLYGWSGGAASRLTRMAHGCSCCSGAAAADARAATEAAETEERGHGCLSSCSVPREFWQHVAAVTTSGRAGSGRCLTSWRIVPAATSSSEVGSKSSFASHGRCSFGNGVDFEYRGKPTRARVVSWLLELECRSYYVQLFPATAATILQSLRACNVTTIVFRDDSEAGIKVAELAMQALHRWYPALCGLSVSPGDEEEEISSLTNRYGVVSKPALLLLRRHLGATDVVHLSTDSSGDQLDFYVWSMLQPLQRLSQDKFVSDVLTAEQGHVPILVAFYSCWCENARSFLEAFVRTSQHMADTSAEAAMRFATLDLTEYQSVLLLLTKFSPMRCPFVLLFYGRREGHRVDVAYTEVSANSLPTPAAVLDSLSRSIDFLRSSQFDVAPYTTWGHAVGQVSHLSEGPYGMQCFPTSSNLTESEPIADPVAQLDSANESSMAAELMPELATHSGIKIATNDYMRWLMAPIAERNESDSATLSIGKTASAVRIVVVIFIRALCTSCESNMHTFAEFAQAAESMSPGGSTAVYLVNCSQTADLCTHQAVSGYPSLLAIRLIDLTTVDGCLSRKTASGLSHSHIKYHGPLTVSELMRWLSAASATAVTNADYFYRHLTDAREVRATDGVSLVAAFVPRQLERFLPASRRLGWSHFYPYRCFRLACEILFGPVKCYSELSSAVPASAYKTDGSVSIDADSVVTQVELVRGDGFRASLMELQRPLAELLHHEELEATRSSFSGEGPFEPSGPLHSAHQYGLEQMVTCEDDHSLCTDFIVQFTRDHGRLPVTHMTPEMFHINSGLIGPVELPVLVALMHPDNFTVGSKFSQTLRNVAVSLYKYVRVATVDVTTYPAWVAQFVPLEERFDLRHDVGSALYRYPRFCLVDWSDHSKAAFHPPLDVPSSEHDAHLSLAGLTSFVQRFLTDPESMLVATDSF